MTSTTGTKRFLIADLRFLIASERQRCARWGGSNQKSKIKNQKLHAFTLVELLVAVSIIVFMAAALVVGVSGVRARAAKAATKAELAKLQIALEKYKDKYGVYPTKDRTLYKNAPNLDAALSRVAEQKLVGFLEQIKFEPRDSEVQTDYVYNDAGTQKFDKKADDSFASSDADALLLRTLVDSYENPIGYMPFLPLAKGYRIYSLGPDGLTASNDGIDNDGDGVIDEDDDNPPTQNLQDREGYKFNGKIGDDITP